MIQLLMFFQYSVNRGLRRQIKPFISQSRHNLGRWQAPVLRFIAGVQNGRLFSVSELVRLYNALRLQTLILRHSAIFLPPAFQGALAQPHQVGSLVACSTIDHGFVEVIQEPCTLVQRSQLSSLSGSSPYKASSFFDSTSNEVVSARARSLRRTSAFSFLMVLRESRCCF